MRPYDWYEGIPDEIAEAANEYVRLGLSIVWLRPGGKAPLRMGWQHLPALPDGYVRDCNLGIRCGSVSGVVCVDLDSPAAVEYATRHLPYTPWRTLTGSGGQHWYYRYPPDKVIPNKVKIGGLSIDLRSDGGLAVAAPSVHANGKTYTQIEKWTTAELPLFDPSWFAEHKPVVSNVRQSVNSGSASISRARKYMQSLSPAVAGQGGHKQTLLAAAALTRGFCLSDADSLALLREYNCRCVPPWEEKDLVRKLKESRKLNQLQPDGWLRDAAPRRLLP
jgi:hypothetical protein